MPLLNVDFYGSKEEVYPGLSGYGAILFWQNNGHGTRESIIATNIEQLRTKALYAYLFVSRSLELQMLTETLTEDQKSYSGMEIRRLKRGVWLTSPDYPGAVTTLVVNIGEGEILPFAGRIYDDFHALLCLPQPKSLEFLDDVTTHSKSIPDTIAILLAEGGFVLDAIDHRNFRILTSDKSYADFFRPASPQDTENDN